MGLFAPLECLVAYYVETVAQRKASHAVIDNSGGYTIRNIMSLVVILRDMRRLPTVTRIFRFLPLLVLTLFCVQFASAQSTFDVNVGFGAAQDSNSKAGIDVGSANLGPCSSATVSGNCVQTGNLSGFMLGFGANLMLWKHFGLGFGATVQPAQANYATLQTVAQGGGVGTALKDRVTFYNVDGIFQPYSSKKVNFQLMGGVGAANVKFYEAFSSQGSVLGNTNQSQYAQSANHFNVHAGVGVQLYVSGNIFIRPEFDIHYVPNFVQFGRNIVTQEMVWVGYSFGNR